MPMIRRYYGHKGSYESEQLAQGFIIGHFYALYSQVYALSHVQCSYTCALLSGVCTVVRCVHKQINTGSCRSVNTPAAVQQYGNNSGSDKYLTIS